MEINVLQEVRTIWNKLNEIERKQSDFTETRHAESVDSITTLAEMEEEALCDIDLAYNDRAAEIEEALCELSEIMDVQ